MTAQADTYSNMYKHTRRKTLAANIITIVTMITLTNSIFLSEHGVDAQMMEDHAVGRAGIITSGQQQQQHEQRMINNGTINLEKIIFQSIESRINTSLSQAMANAEKSLGNNSLAVAAFGSEEGGYFAYRIILATPEMEFYWVKVDPGNGQILQTQHVSQKELDKMHREHSAMVVSNSGRGSFGVNGFPFIIPH